jgi:hypothetical protein
MTDEKHLTREEQQMMQRALRRSVTPSPAPAVGELVALYTWKEYSSVISALNTALARIGQLEAGLREIAKGEGEFSRDPLTHATNTIESMKAIATATLKGQS